MFTSLVDRDGEGKKEAGQCDEQQTVARASELVKGLENEERVTRDRWRCVTLPTLSRSALAVVSISGVSAASLALSIRLGEAFSVFLSASLLLRILPLAYTDIWGRRPHSSRQITSGYSLYS